MNNDDRDKLLEEISAKVGDIHSTMKLHTDILARHDKSLYGNGNPGICQRVDTIDTLQQECRKGQRNRAASLPAWVQNIIALGSLITAGAALVIASK